MKIIHLQCLIQDLNLGSGMNIVTFKRVMNLVNDLRDIARDTICNQPYWGAETMTLQANA